MIKYIKRKDIDINKYDACIENSVQSRIYAFSWYLNIVADNWDVLVLDDYEAVMPIPWKQKYFIKYITQPYFCQQLGVFSKSKIDEIIEKKFINKIPFFYFKITLNLNSGNYPNKSSIEKKNYILSLKDDYDSLFRKFSKTRKQRVKSGYKNELKISKVSIDSLLEIHKKNYSYEGFSIEIISKLSSFIVNYNKGELLGVYKEDKLLGGGLFLKSEKKIIYIYSSFDEDGRKYQAASFLINYIIKSNTKSNLILDFEGGNIPSIAAFFKSFGALPEKFYQYSKKLL